MGGTGFPFGNQIFLHNSYAYLIKYCSSIICILKINLKAQVYQINYIHVIWRLLCGPSMI